MPLHWSSIDTRNAIISAAVPTLPALVGSSLLIQDEKILNFFKNQAFPSCAITCKAAYLLNNTATLLPFGYASYLVYKIGGGFDYTDTTVALGLYGATVLSGLTLIPVLKKQNMKAIAANTGVLAALAVGTTVTFYTIDKISAYWALPFTLWTLYCAGVAISASGCCGKRGPGPMA